MTFAMFLAWQTQGDAYKGAFDTCTNAYYQGSDAKRYADAAVDKAKQMFPIVASTAPLIYAIGVKKEIQFTTSKFSLIGTQTAYYYNRTTHSGTVAVTWRF